MRAVSAVPEPGKGTLHTYTMLSHVFFMNPELALTLAHLKFPESKNSKKKKKSFLRLLRGWSSLFLLNLL
jgi:hypothetical protein